MTLSLTHATVVAVTDDGVSPVGTNEWNAQHNFTMAANMVLGRITTAGAVQELTGAQITTLVAGSSGGGTTNFLRADGVWAVPPVNISLAVATTPITGGTSGNFLFDNAGVLGEQTPTQITALLGVFSGTLKGLAPASGGGTTNFLRADGTWAAPPTSVNLGVGSSPITSGASGNYLFDNGALLGERTPTQVTATLDTFTTALKGLTPASAGGTTNFLRADGSWAAPPPAGSGVQQLNTLTGNLAIAAGTGITVAAPAGTTITIGGALFTPSANGDVPASGGGTANFLRADGTWNPPPLPPLANITGQCQLAYVDATHIRLNRKNGSKLKINGALYDVPSAGVIADITNCYLNGVAASALVAGTTYNVFAFVLAGAVTLDFSTTARATDTTVGNDGVEVKSGDSSRSLVGKVIAFAGPNVGDNSTSRGVISWFNRRQRVAQSYVPSGSTSSTGWVGAGSVITFLTWGDEEIEFNLTGYTLNSAVSNNQTQITVDGGAVASPMPAGAIVSCTGGYYFGFASCGGAAFTEGAHNFQTQVAVTAGSGQWTMTATAKFNG